MLEVSFGPPPAPKKSSTRCVKCSVQFPYVCRITRDLVRFDLTIGHRLNSVGPVPGQRGTICKLSIGDTPYGAYHSESSYRPHLFSTLPRTDITQIDFALRDSRGNLLDLKDTNLAFVVTFDSSHLMQ